MQGTRSADLERRARREAGIDALVMASMVLLIVVFAGGNAMQKLNEAVVAPIAGFITYFVRIPMHRRRLSRKERG